MVRKAPCRLGFVLSTLALLASPGTAAQDGQDEEAAPGPAGTCLLHLSIDEQGTAAAGLSVQWAQPSGMKPKQVEEALRGSFPAPLRTVKRQAHRDGITITGRIVEGFPLQDGRIEGDLDLAPLAKLLRPLGIPHIEVWVVGVSGRSSRPDHQRAWQHHVRVSTATPTPVHFALGAKPGACIWSLTTLTALVLIPVGLVLWRRRLALREADRTMGWYRFMRSVSWTVLGTWAVWLTAASALEVDALLASVLPTEVGMSRATRWAVLLMPPWFVTVCCSAVAREVFGRLSGSPRGTGVCRRVALSLVGTMIPLLLVVIGISSLVDGSFRAGALWLVAALGMRLLGTRRGIPRRKLEPYALTTGELRDRVFALAGKMGVALRQVYVLPTGEIPEVHAFAALGGSVYISEHLLGHLSRREVEAVAAHELAHLKFHHPVLLLILFVGVLVTSVLVQPVLLPWLEDLWLGHLPIGLVVALAILFAISRRFEHQTDSYAAWLVGDPEALITGLIKLHRLSLLPMRWGKWEEGLMTHPSTSFRLEVIARENGISRQRLEEIIDQPDSSADRYPLPTTVTDEGQIFSADFRARMITRVSGALLSGMLLTPALAAAAVSWGAWEEGIEGGILAGGAILTAVVLLTLHNYVSQWGCAEVRRRLASRLKVQGIDVDAWGGTFVGFAPASCPRLYDQFTNWDFGFLFLAGERLCYVGEHTRFALMRRQVTEVCPGPGDPNWWPVPYLYLTWKDPEQGTGGTWNLQAAEGSTRWQLRRSTRKLEAAVRRWCEEPPQEAADPAALKELAPPALGEVSGTPVAALWRPWTQLLSTILVLFLGAGISLLLGLSLDPDQGGMAWYVPLIACLAGWFETLPLWRSRTSARQQARGSGTVSA